MISDQGSVYVSALIQNSIDFCPKFEMTDQKKKKASREHIRFPGYDQRPNPQEAMMVERNLP